MSKCFKNFLKETFFQQNFSPDKELRSILVDYNGLYIYIYKERERERETERRAERDRESCLGLYRVHIINRF